MFGFERAFRIPGPGRRWLVFLFGLYWYRRDCRLWRAVL